MATPETAGCMNLKALRISGGLLGCHPRRLGFVVAYKPGYDSEESSSRRLVSQHLPARWLGGSVPPQDWRGDATRSGSHSPACCSPCVHRFLMLSAISGPLIIYGLGALCGFIGGAWAMSGGKKSEQRTEPTEATGLLPRRSKSRGSHARRRTT